MLTKKKELYNRRRQRSEIDRILQKQRAFFAEGKTYEIRFRKAALKRLEVSILAHEKEVCQALTEDLGKSETEGYMCEVGLTLAEIRGLYRNVKAYSKTKRVPVSMANFPAKGYLVQEPYGVTLVMSPWNYPFMLALTIALSIIATVILSKVIGSMLPMLAKKCRLDPAIMATPLITTIVDCCSLFLYFNIATIVFSHIGIL